MKLDILPSHSWERLSQAKVGKKQMKRTSFFNIDELRG